MKTFAKILAIVLMLHAHFNIIAQNYATLPYNNNFESGKLDDYWTTSSTGSNSQIIVSNKYTPHLGNYHLIISSSSFDINEASLHLNLAGESNITLSYFWKEFGDESHSEDGIYFSEDGGNSFTKVQSFSGGSNTDNNWEQFILDVDYLAALYGLNLNSTFVIKFQQYDNDNINPASLSDSDGFAFDDIRITNNSPNHAQLPFFDGFEGGLNSSWEIKTPNLRSRCRISSKNTPRTGDRHLLLDAVNYEKDEFVSNEAWLYLDLSGETDVSFSFFWKDFDEEKHDEDGVYFSDDNGNSFTKVRDFRANEEIDGVWLYEEIDVDLMASVYSLSLNKSFVIKIEQHDDSNILDGTNSNDGIAIDDVKVETTKAPVYTTIPYNMGFETGSFDDSWTTKVGSQTGLVKIRPSFDPNSGDYHLLMAKSKFNSPKVQTEAWLHLNLNGENDVYLSFYWKDYGDEHDDQDGIFLSMNGGDTFIKVYDLNTSNPSYQKITLDLASIVAAIPSLNFSSTFVIKFQQKDNSIIPSDGFAFDDINVYSTTTSWTGNTSTHWYIGSNWTNGEPNDKSYVSIPDVSTGTGIYPEIRIGTGEVGILNIEANASINIVSTGSLKIHNNWINSGSSYIGNGTVEFVGNDLQQIIGSTTFQNMTINNSGNGIELAGTQQVNGILNLTNGKIKTTSEFTLTLNDDATIINCSSNSYINGPLTKIGNDNFIYCIGNDDRFARLGITAPASNTSQFTAKYIADRFGYKTIRESSVNHVSNLEYWDLSRDVGTDDVKVSLFWEDSYSDISDLSSLIVSHWDGSKWTNEGGTTSGNVYTGSITSGNSLSSFSPITFGSSNANNPLPVELSHFSAKPINNYVELSWITLSEINNDYFTIQRSLDGNQFKDLFKVKGAGNSNKKNVYSKYDSNPYMGTSYYRLKQTDFNGNVELSDVVSVLVSSSSYYFSPILIFPNPSDGFKLKFKLPHGLNVNDKANLNIYDVKGNNIFSIRNKKIEEKITLSKKLNPGIYLITVFTKNNLYKGTFIVK